LRRVKETKMSDAQMEELETKEEEEIVKEGEIMKLANPEDEQEEGLSGEEE